MQAVGMPERYCKYLFPSSKVNPLRPYLPNFVTNKNSLDRIK